MFLLIPLILSILSLTLIKSKYNSAVVILPYSIFLIAPVLTYFEIIGTLTGFDEGESNFLTFGMTFYTVYLAYQLSKHKNKIIQSPYKFIFGVCNPLYFFTGPIPNRFGFSTKNYKLKRMLKISSVVSGDVGVGLLFASILAPSLSTLFYLKESLNTVDVILFGIIFEFFVYFNFAGFSMIAWSLMRIAGFKVPRNFRHPFSAISIIDYWQRWHISLSQILKELFFKKLKLKIGLNLTVLVVFSASAIWHGVSKNFIMWGIFHAAIWSLSHYISKYRKLFFINYCLFIFAVVVGRIIFSEMDFNLLVSKLESIINISKWSSESVGIYVYSMKDALNLVIATVIILWEVISPRCGSTDKDYRYLRNPFVSTLLIFYVTISFTGFGGVPVYGQR